MIHFHHETQPKKGNPFTLASDIIDGKLYFGVAVCSKRDSYSRKKGREISKGRLDKAVRLGKTIYLPDLKDSRKKWLDTQDNIIDTVSYIGIKALGNVAEREG